jgi:aspartate aminotransferase-like enzyme
MIKLFIPGPVEVKREIRREMARQMIGHRTPEFQNLHKEIVWEIRALLGTDKEVFLLTCSATGAMEAAIRNTVEKKVLCLANGAFGKRWFEIAMQNGKEAQLLDFGEGIAYDYGAVEEELKKGYEAVTVVLNDSATGIENNIGPIKALLKEFPGTLLLVDVVTGAFGTEIDFEGVDVGLFGTQKALALPPGVAIMIVDKKAMRRAKGVKDRGYYFDFIGLGKNAGEGYTLTTPNIPLLFALRKRLAWIRKMTMERHIERHLKNAEMTREFFRRRGFRLLVDQKNMSKTVTVVENNKGINIDEMIEYLQKRGYAIAKGYGKLKDQTFRIGHMGVGFKDTQRLLKEIDGFLAK